MGVLKMLAVLIAVIWMTALESVRPRAKDEEDVALFVGSAHPLVASGRKRDSVRRPRR
jgi:hypothetical protein